MQTAIVCDSKTFKLHYKRFLAECPIGIKDSPGVYIFYDAGEDNTYVASAVNVFKMVQKHLDGKYNGYNTAPDICDRYEITILLCKQNELSDLRTYFREKYRAGTAYHPRT